MTKADKHVCRHFVKPLIEIFCRLGVTFLLTSSFWKYFMVPRARWKKCNLFSFQICESHKRSSKEDLLKSSWWTKSKRNDFCANKR